MIIHPSSWLPLILLALLALLAALSFWLSQSAPASSPAQDNEIGRTPDYRMENFSATRMDQDGFASHVLVAKEMVHYPDDDTTDLEQPLFIDIEPGKPVLQIKADKAKIPSNNEDIYLTGNVMVLRNAAKGRSEITMTTSSLHLIPDEDIARTDKPVVITEKKSVINAVGMEMNSRTSIIKLFSRVRVIHDNVR